MRPRIVSIVVALSLLVFGSLFMICQNSNRFPKRTDTQPAASNTTQPSEASASATSQPADQTPAPPGSSTQPGIQPAASPEEEHKTYVEQRSAQLMDLAMTDDRSSLDSILSELTNRDPEIRKAALDAAIQFGSRDAIPKLADAASQTDDPNEKTAITDAIEFLKLPSLTEISSHSPKPVANNSNVGSRPAHKGAWGKR